MLREERESYEKEIESWSEREGALGRGKSHHRGRRPKPARRDGHGSAECTAGRNGKKEERGGENLLATWGPPFRGFHISFFFF